MKKGCLISLIIFQMFWCLNSNAQDWPGLNRYHYANEILKTMPNNGKRVVFMGNSITDSWINNDSVFFSVNNYIDRGISGQTSPQMLLRFRADVIYLNPAAVVLLCGINDIAGNTGPATLEMIEDNIQSMAELAEANKIKIILCSVLPAYDIPWKPNTFPAEKIATLNKWISDYANQKHFSYIDYYSAFVDERKGMKNEYSQDGVHPNKAGYIIMENLAQPVIRKLIKLKIKSEKESL